EHDGAKAEGFRDQDDNDRRYKSESRDDGTHGEDENREERPGIWRGKFRRGCAEHHDGGGSETRDPEGKQRDEKAKDDLHVGQSVIAIARSAMRSRAESFCVSDFNWPQAARMSRPRGL